MKKLGGKPSDAQQLRGPGTRSSGNESRDCLLFHYPLCLPCDDDNRSRKQFITSYVRLGDWVVEMRNQELRKRIANFRKRRTELKRKHAATVSAINILKETGDHLEDPSFDLEGARERFFATGLSREELRLLVDQLTTAAEEVDEGAQEKDRAALVAQEKELRGAERQRRREVKYLKDETVIFKALQRLLDAVLRFDDEHAAEALHSGAQMACALLGFVTDLKPELLRRTARTSQQWPVMLGVSPDSQTRAASKLEQLQIGADTIYGRLRRERAFRESTPARAYARVIVETIW